MSAPVIERPQVLPSDGGLDREFWVHAETEFEKSCQVTKPDGKDCDQKATWMCYASHTTESCPSKDFFFCDEHMKIAFDWWIEVLKINREKRCQGCDAIITGNLSNHLHAIKL